MRFLDRTDAGERLAPLVRKAAAAGARIVCTTECFLDGNYILEPSGEAKAENTTR